ncbi:hypothetical protein M430DRAFT_40653 [Amorphotheca resinae ATCC 22711]|uniref:Uncharacterized protein n=1 Tax=Amorphotheca resinae ATCC 22711 TaxID=857342 RepID=A0A2T3B9H2_AMORE|nr:hypothetical protein M430DRAFT_40653 [Amorphotheca resinae ATCC 22711]PSS23491.1 hypothetical protein M430DRAFT_40653 [Amorphotheca resinae ATCC 22711]
MQLYQVIVGAALLVPALAAGTPPPTSKHWGLECGPQVRLSTCKDPRHFTRCNGANPVWTANASPECELYCHCSEDAGTPPPAYGKEHPPQIPPIRPVSPLNLNGKKGGKVKREELFVA